MLQSRVWRTTHSPTKSLTSPNGICKPIPASSVNSECKFSGVFECSIIFYLQVTKGTHANLTLPIQEDWTGAPVIPQNLPSYFSRHSIHPYSRISQGLIRQTLPKQSTQTRVWQFSDPYGFPTSSVIIMPPHMLQGISMSSFKPYKSSFLRQLLRWLKYWKKSQLWSTYSQIS